MIDRYYPTSWLQQRPNISSGHNTAVSLHSSEPCDQSKFPIKNGFPFQMGRFSSSRHERNADNNIPTRKNIPQLIASQRGMGVVTNGANTTLINQSQEAVGWTCGLYIPGRRPDSSIIRENMTGNALIIMNITFRAENLNKWIGF